MQEFLSNLIMFHLMTPITSQIRVPFDSNIQDNLEKYVFNPHISSP